MSARDEPGSAAIYATIAQVRGVAQVVLSVDPNGIQVGRVAISRL